MDLEDPDNTSNSAHRIQLYAEDYAVYIYIYIHAISRRVPVLYAEDYAVYVYVYIYMYIYIYGFAAGLYAEDYAVYIYIYICHSAISAGPLTKPKTTIQGRRPYIYIYAHIYIYIYRERGI